MHLFEIFLAACLRRPRCRGAFAVGLPGKVVGRVATSGPREIPKVTVFFFFLFVGFVVSLLNAVYLVS